MSNPEDDPRITAYALNELDAEERRAFEAELAANPDLQNQVAGAQTAAGAVGAALKHEQQAPLRRLSPARRLRIQAEIQSARTDGAARAESAKMKIIRWSTSRTVAAAAAILACAVMLWIARSPSNGKVAAAREQLRRVHAALLRYQSDHHQLPPDSGFGLPAADAPRGAGSRYDAGVLWRYLDQSSAGSSGSGSPYLHFSADELVAYNDPVHGRSFYVVDPWGTPLGFVGDPRRVLHNSGTFDLYSAGPDRLTGQDLVARATSDSNRAYDGLDNDQDGVADDGSELGIARLNGCLTVASAGQPAANFALDDLNNWDQ